MSIFTRNTPLIVGKSIGHCKTMLKLDYLQPSGSFKDRGISHMMKTLTVDGVTKVICSSGGNAGNAVATAGAKLGLSVDVFVPTTTMPKMVELIESNANTRCFINGENWNAANQYALKALEEAGEGKAIYIPPYDHPLIWTGNSTIIDELVESCTCTVNGDINLNKFPQVIVCSVGGGGLLRGIQLGIEKYNLQNHTQIYAVETTGAASYAAAGKYK